MHKGAGYAIYAVGGVRLVLNRRDVQACGWSRLVRW